MHFLQIIQGALTGTGYNIYRQDRRGIRVRTIRPSRLSRYEAVCVRTGTRRGVVEPQNLLNRRQLRNRPRSVGRRCPQRHYYPPMTQPALRPLRGCTWASLRTCSRRPSSASASRCGAPRVAGRCACSLRPTGWEGFTKKDPSTGNYIKIPVFYDADDMLWYI